MALAARVFRRAIGSRARTSGSCGTSGARWRSCSRENYYGHFAELAHRHGLQFSDEPYGNGNFDEMEAGAPADIPMGEFWRHKGAVPDSCWLAASLAHVYGRKIVGTESFTGAPGRTPAWSADPFALKALGD